MQTLYLFSVWLHILAAIVWVGGMTFMVFILIPVLKKPEFSSFLARALNETGIKYRFYGWLSFFILLTTGSFNMYMRGYRFENIFTAEVWSGATGRALLYKLGLFATVVLLSGLHDFWIGPKAARLWVENPSSPEAHKLRSQARIFGRVTFLLGLIILFFAVGVVRGLP